MKNWILVLCFWLAMPVCFALDPRWMEVPGTTPKFYYDSQTIQRFRDRYQFWYKVDNASRPVMGSMDCSGRVMNSYAIAPESTEEMVYYALCNNKKPPTEIILSTGRKVKLPESGDSKSTPTVFKGRYGTYSF